jgi:hypothetical protein
MPVFDFFHWHKDKGGTLEETGAMLQVTIGIPPALEQFCLKNGIQIPQPIAGYALIDTGASASAVHEQIFTDFGVQPIDHIPMSTPHTKDKSSFVYPAKIQFPGLNLVGDFMLSMMRVVGCELKWKTFDDKEIIMLVGRDLLKYFLMVYNGVQSDVTLSY